MKYLPRKPLRCCSKLLSETSEQLNLGVDLKVKMSSQMENILLAMLKAERDPTSTIGQIRAKNAETYGKPGLGTMNLMSFIKGALALDAQGKPRQTARRSYWRSLKTMLKYGLIRVTLEKSPGKHGHLYGLTSKGLAKAEEIWAEVSIFVEERGRLI